MRAGGGVSIKASKEGCSAHVLAWLHDSRLELCQPVRVSSGGKYASLVVDVGFWRLLMHRCASSEASCRTQSSVGRDAPLVGRADVGASWSLLEAGGRMGSGGAGRGELPVCWPS